VAQVAFEIARRHRFVGDLAALPTGVALHVLPAGDETPPSTANLRYRNFSRVAQRIDQAYRAARRSLDRSDTSEDGAA
jgi:NTE family protein